MKKALLVLALVLPLLAACSQGGSQGPAATATPQIVVVTSTPPPTTTARPRPTIAPTAVERGTTIANPIPVGLTDGWELTSQPDGEEEVKYTIRVLEIVGPPDAWDRIRNGYTDPAPDGQEYLMARLEVIAIGGTGSLDLLELSWELQSRSKGRGLDIAWADLDDDLGEEGLLYAGGMASGWLVFQIVQGDTTPLMSMEFSDGSHLFWALYQ